MVSICCRVHTEDPEHEADLNVSEENVGRTKRVLERVVDVLTQSVVVVVGPVEQSRSGGDDVGPIIQSERGRCQQEQEAEVRQRVCDELGRRTAHRTRYLNNTTTITTTITTTTTTTLILTLTLILIFITACTLHLNN